MKRAERRAIKLKRRRSEIARFKKFLIIWQLPIDSNAEVLENWIEYIERGLVHG